MLEQEWIIDFAGARLVAPLIVRDLDMGDAGKMFLQAGREFALHALHMIDVVLQKQVVRSHVIHDFQRLRAA